MPRPVIPIADGRIDLANGRVVRRDRVCQLTAQDVRILTRLLDPPGAVVSREVLMVEVLGYPPASTTRAVDLTIGRLRSKIEPDPRAPAHLLTVFGRGYRLVEAPEGEAPSVRTNLAPPRDAWIGRTGRLATLLDTLCGDHPVAWVLTGTAGVGKSRLAAELARRAAPTAFPGGAYQLAAAASRAPAAGLAEHAELSLRRPTAGTTARALADRGRTLVVLDGLDQAGEGFHGLIAALIDAGVSVIATALDGRAAPGLEARAVPPLDADDAAALFVARAQAARPEWVPSAEDHVAIARIAAATDGVPLALELAAPRVRSMSPGAISTALAASDRLLRVPRGGRHRSMAAALAWSWEALDASGRRALAALTVFEGGATREAACAVLPGPDAEAAVDDLVARSLVRADALGRLQTFRSVSTHARGHAPEGELERARGSHLDWVYAWSRARIAVQDRVGQAPDLPGVVAERGNLRAALDHALAVRPDAAAVLLQTLCSDNSPHAVVAVDDYAERVLAGLGGPSVARGRVLALHAWALQHRGDPEAAEQVLVRLLGEGLQVGDRRNVVTAHCALASCLAARGQLPDALAHAHAAVDAAGDDGPRRDRALVALCGTALAMGRLDLAEEAAEAAVASAGARGDLTTVAGLWINLGSARALKGDFDGAFAMWRRAEPVVAASVPARRTVLLLNRGWAQLMRGDAEAAAIDLEQAADLCLEVGFSAQHRLCLLAAAVAHARLELWPTALELAHDAWTRAEAAASPQVPLARSIVGGVLLGAGRVGEAEAAFRDAGSNLGSALGLHDGDVARLLTCYRTGVDHAAVHDALQAPGPMRMARSMHLHLLLATGPGSPRRPGPHSA